MISDRFIPAPAGNSRLRSGWLPGRPVHPRACGEQSGNGLRLKTSSGSSPRLRGTVQGKTALFWLQRFIPAPAGNSVGLSFFSVGSSVHPRACGEQYGIGCNRLRCVGSSPRLRGTARIGPPSSGLSRFIPAPAGNRSSPSLPHRAQTVHPRACGEQSPPPAVTTKLIGSSPRLRGTARRTL